MPFYPPCAGKKRLTRWINFSSCVFLLQSFKLSRFSSDFQTRHIYHDCTHSLSGTLWPLMYVSLCFSVHLLRAPGQSLGISIMGGRGMGRRLSSGDMMRGVFIKHISPDSPAALNGTLRTGDRILEVCPSGCV
uniref:PDZ domain-containing protein n=1 Tax=Neogobius melanostomus TaxID=47308 RepID=A0A8C6U6X9_9GOBI